MRKNLKKMGLIVALLVFIPLSTFAQRTISGVVKDANGAVPGVTVAVKGTTTATATDMNGKYNLSVPNSAKSLVYSFIGYETQTVAIGGRANINVTMVESATTLNEVVAIGYGTMKKRDLTGSVSSVKSNDIVRVPTSNVMEAIQGQVAGFDITRSSGEVGADMNMSLRGLRSINGTNTPLFIIDGAQGSYAELNPNDIASIEVLKDASSTAIYGSAGANGVILITTKSPQKGKLNVNLDAYYGWNVISNFPEIRSGEDYLNLRREAARTQGKWNSTADDSSIFPSYIWNLVQNNDWVDWFDLASQTGTTNQVNLSTSYANDRTSSYFSLGYYKIEGLIKDDAMTRYTLRAKVDHQLAKQVKVGVNIYALYSDNDKRNDRVWNRIIGMPPLGTPYDENGEVVHFPVGGNTSDISPITDMQKGQYVNNVKTISMMPQAYLEITPIKGLSFKSTVSGYLKNSRQGIYEGNNSWNGLATGSYASIPNKFTYNYKWENVLTYNFTIAKDHKFTVTAASDWTKNRYEESTARANVFDTDSYMYYNLGAATGTPQVSSSFTQSQMMSYIARVNYTYKDRYMLTLSDRVDGASQLASGHKWDSFPAAAIAWRISDEKFMAGTKSWLDNLKLRASYGVTGNAGASEYATLDYSRTGIFGFGETSVAYSGYSSNIANLNLKWEKTSMIDLGFDMSILNNRIDITFDYYHSRTKDVLFQKKLPYADGGYASSTFTIWDNVGKTKNTGIELAINSRNIITKDFTWTTALAFAANKNEVVKTTSDGALTYGNYYLIPGEDMQTYYGLKYLGIWKQSEADEAAKYGQTPGSIHVEDVNGDYKYNASDYQVLGKNTPDWTGSLTNTFTYKNFDLTVAIIARWGWTINYGLTGWYRANGLTGTPAVCDYYTPENENARFPRPDMNISELYPYQETLNYYDGSYIKVRDISLGYTLPKNWIAPLHMSNVRIYFTTNNPFIYTKSHYLKDYDPEKGGNDDTTPLSKQYVFGVNISF
jgi:TonB-linked SusC/RagA family outer membrane protein